MVALTDPGPVPGKVDKAELTGLDARAEAPGDLVDTVQPGRPDSGSGVEAGDPGVHQEAGVGDGGTSPGEGGSCGLSPQLVAAVGAVLARLLLEGEERQLLGGNFLLQVFDI